jgi:hypothetical protein
MRDVEEFSRTWAARVEADPLAVEVIESLWARREMFALPVIARARDENHEIDAVIAEDFRETREHVLEHFRAMLALPVARARDLGDDPMGFVRRHGVRRAQGGVTLQAVLQAYRTGHKSFWAAMCHVIGQRAPTAEAGMRVTMLLSDYCIDYTDLISVVVTDAYLQEEAKLAEERTRLGISVMEALLGGAAPRLEDGWRLCGQVGLAAGMPMVVVVGCCPSAGDGALVMRALSLLARGVETALPRETFGRLVVVRGLEVLAVVAAESEPGLRVSQALLAAERTLDAEVGGFQFGVGLDVDAIADLPSSHHQASVALKLSGGKTSVARLAEIGVDAYLRRTADGTARKLALPLTNSVLSGELGRTIDAFAAASLNVKACSRTLGVHNNTIYHRLNQIRRLTGLDPRTFDGLSSLVTARAIALNGPLS